MSIKSSQDDNDIPLADADDEAIVDEENTNNMRTGTNRNSPFMTCIYFTLFSDRTIDGFHSKFVQQFRPGSTRQHARRARREGKANNTSA